MTQFDLSWDETPVELIGGPKDGETMQLLKGCTEFSELGIYSDSRAQTPGRYVQNPEKPTQFVWRGMKKINGCWGWE